MNDREVAVKVQASCLAAAEVNGLIATATCRYCLRLVGFYVSLPALPMYAWLSCRVIARAGLACGVVLFCQLALTSVKAAVPHTLRNQMYHTTLFTYAWMEYAASWTEGASSGATPSAATCNQWRTQLLHAFRDTSG